MDGQFTRAGAWNQIAGTEQVEKFLTRKPLSAANQFVLHHGDVCRGTSEGGEAQPQEERGEFSYRDALRR